METLVCGDSFESRMRHAIVDMTAAVVGFSEE